MYHTTRIYQRIHDWTASLEGRRRPLAAESRAATPGLESPTASSRAGGRGGRVHRAASRLPTLSRWHAWAVFIKLQTYSLLWTKRSNFDTSAKPETLCCSQTYLKTTKRQLNVIPRTPDCNYGIAPFQMPASPGLFSCLSWSSQHCKLRWSSSGPLPTTHCSDAETS